jgi:hypothetical protein
MFLFARFNCEVDIQNQMEIRCLLTVSGLGECSLILKFSSITSVIPAWIGYF